MKLKTFLEEYRHIEITRENKDGTPSKESQYINKKEIPFDRPPGSSMTSARTTVPHCLKKSLSSCHFTCKGVT